MLGKPVLALPLALDQPAVATHMERLGVAEVLSPQERSADKIREELVKIRTENRYREAAQAIQAQLQSLHGTAQAATIVEDTLSSQTAFVCATRETVTQ